MADRRMASALSQGESYAYGIAVPQSLHEAIEEERENLSQLDSLLGCLTIAMEYDGNSEDAPYFPDVARQARTLLKKSLRALDCATLKTRILHDQVKEDVDRVLTLVPTPANEVDEPAPSSATREASARRVTLRVHRRLYSSASRDRLRCASSAETAAVMISG